MTEELRKRLEWVRQEKEKLRKYSKEALIDMVMFGNVIWEAVENYDVCPDDYGLIDRYEYPSDKYADTDDGVIRKEMYHITYHEDGSIEDYWLKEEYQ